MPHKEIQTKLSIKTNETVFIDNSELSKRLSDEILAFETKINDYNDKH